MRNKEVGAHEVLGGAGECGELWVQRACSAVVEAPQVVVREALLVGEEVLVGVAEEALVGVVAAEEAVAEDGVVRAGRGQVEADVERLRVEDGGRDGRELEG